MDLVPYAIPFFFLAMGLELAYGIARRRNTYRVNDSVGSLFMGTLRTASKLVLIGLGGAVFAAIEQRYALWRMDVSHWATWVFAFVSYDLCYYWNHRIGHERQVFWASHVAHHQSEEYNLTTALRQTSTGFLLSWVFYVPMFLVGVPAEIYVTVASANLIYQFWVHTEHIPKLGWYEWIFVTPSNHRVHHAQNDTYVDRNYGGVFILWDRLFGTFQEEREDEPCIYGIRGPLHTFSPLWANLHIYFGMAQDAWRARRWRDKLHVFVARTGWRPPDVAVQYPREKTDLENFRKYDPPVGVAVSAYALLHLVLVMAAGIALLFIPGLSWATNATVVALMLFTMVCTGHWLDGRQVVNLELARLGATAVAAWLGWQAGFGLVFAFSVAAYAVFILLALPLLSQAGRTSPALVRKSA
jgi:sterol desaturase/sphingolipid hydroxylase (fatty acid hydroxylase superfamily)